MSFQKNDELHSENLYEPLAFLTEEPGNGKMAK